MIFCSEKFMRSITIKVLHLLNRLKINLFTPSPRGEIDFDYVGLAPCARFFATLVAGVNEENQRGNILDDNNF